MELEARGLLGKTIEEIVLACATNDEETLQPFAAVQSDAIENLCVLCRETVKDQTRKDGSVFGAIVQRSKAFAHSLRVDALRHVSRE
jgi:hypothetical protein